MLILYTALAVALSGCAADREPQAQGPAQVNAVARQVIPKVERAVGLKFRSPPAIAVRSSEQVHAYLNVTGKEWMQSYTSTVQGMRDDHPGRAPYSGARRVRLTGLPTGGTSSRSAARLFPACWAPPEEPSVSCRDRPLPVVYGLTCRRSVVRVHVRPLDFSAVARQP